MQRNFCPTHKLAEVPGQTKGKAVLSINDHPEMREIYKGFKMKPVSIDDTVGGEEKLRVEKN